MKSLLMSLAFSALLFSCKPTAFFSSYGEVNQTQIVLDSSNFRVLGTFTGRAVEKKSQISIKGSQEGLISAARMDLLAKAKAAGIELTGSRTMVNVNVDSKSNTKHIVATITADIIEFID